MLYGHNKSRLSRMAIIVSLILHVIAFVIFAYVKLYNNESAENARISVTFVDEQRERVLRRSLMIRPTVSVERSKAPQSKPMMQNVYTRVNYRASSDLYLDSGPEVFSQMENIGQEMFQGQGIRKPSVNLRRGMAQGMSIDLRNSEIPSQAQVVVPDGFQLFDREETGLARPELRMPVDIKNLLEDFLKTVRRKIESNKLYPSHARDAGMEGSSGIRMTILKDGTLENVEIIESSGHRILDDAALQSVRNATPFPPILEVLKRDKIELDIYLVFRISET